MVEKDTNSQPPVPSSPPPKPPIAAFANSLEGFEAWLKASAAPPALARSLARPVGSSAMARALVRSSTLTTPCAPTPVVSCPPPTAPSTYSAQARAPVRSWARPRSQALSSALPPATPQNLGSSDWPPSMKGFGHWIEAEKKNRAAADKDNRSARELLEDAYNAFMAAQSGKRIKFIRSAIEPDEATIKQESASAAVVDAIEYADAAVIRRNKAIVELLRLRKAARRRFLTVKLGLPVCLYRVVESDIIQCISWNNADSFVRNNENILKEFITDGYFGNVRSLQEWENSLFDHGFTAAGFIYTHKFGKFVRGHPELLREIKCA